MAATTVLTAEQHNATRRETKRRQQATAKAASAARKAETIKPVQLSAEQIKELAHIQAVKTGLAMNVLINDILDEVERAGSINLYRNDLEDWENQAINELLEWNARQAIPYKIDVYEENAQVTIQFNPIMPRVLVSGTGSEAA